MPDPTKKYINNPAASLPSKKQKAGNHNYSKEAMPEEITHTTNQAAI
jgi:hypothetical protein